MPWSLRWSIALRQTLDPGKGLSAFLSRVSIIGMALAIALLLAVQSVMNGFEREMRERILSLLPHVQTTTEGDAEPLTTLTETLLRDPDIASVRPFIVAGTAMRAYSTGPLLPGGHNQCAALDTKPILTCDASPSESSKNWVRSASNTLARE